MVLRSAPFIAVVLLAVPGYSQGLFNSQSEPVGSSAPSFYYITSGQGLTIAVDLQTFQNTGKSTPLLLPGYTIIVPGSTFEAVQQIISLFRDVALILSGIGTFLLVWRYR